MDSTVNEKMKIFVGCSYTLDLHKFNVNHIRFGQPSSSIQTTLRAIKYIIDDNLYDDVEWVVGITQIGRINKEVPECFTWKISDQFQYPYNRSRLCLFIEGEDELNKPNFPKEWWSEEYRTHFSKPIEEHIKIYLDTIFEIQQILKDSTYSMYLMNNTLDGWFYKKNGDLSHIYTNYEGKNIPSFRDTFTLESLFPQEWSRIDFTKFRFHKMQESEFGGLDEFAIDRYDKTSFTTYKISDINLFGQHPDYNVQWNFFNKVIQTDNSYE